LLGFRDYRHRSVDSRALCENGWLDPIGKKTVALATTINWMKILPSAIRPYVFVHCHRPPAGDRPRVSAAQAFPEACTHDGERTDDMQVRRLPEK
jgi:hypothetical protein